jgi:hypothetical protein
LGEAGDQPGDLVSAAAGQGLRRGLSVVQSGIKGDRTVPHRRLGLPLCFPVSGFDVCGGTVKALSAEFLADLQAHWRIKRGKILDDVAEKYPQQYFAGMVTLARIMRWDVGSPGDFDCPRSPEEIIAKLEQRVGPAGRAIFEEFLAKVAQWRRP